MRYESSVMLAGKEPQKDCHSTAQRVFGFQGGHRLYARSVTVVDIMVSLTPTYGPRGAFVPLTQKFSPNYTKLSSTHPNFSEFSAVSRSHGKVPLVLRARKKHLASQVAIFGELAPLASWRFLPRTQLVSFWLQGMAPIDNIILWTPFGAKLVSFSPVSMTPDAVACFPPSRRRLRAWLVQLLRYSLGQEFRTQEAWPN